MPSPSVILTFSLLCCLQVGGTAATEPQYNRDVRPLLAEKCFRCHGPDSAARQAELRLDIRTSSTATQNGTRAIHPGRPSSSELIRRVTSTDSDTRMPPPEAGEPLGRSEIQLLRRWIEKGAEYQTHWAFIPPSRPVTPLVREQSWARNPIDLFVLARLRRARLQPSPQAPTGTLLRRVTLDLTGLPPTPEEVDAFEQESATNTQRAYHRLVDRLLSSPRYGERMAVAWLDAARYADTNGYFTDNDRTMWPWRDWVIRSFNANMPFDQFTIEQLAGDLLPRSTVDQKIATGFNRNHMVNNETGIIEEEFRVEYVVDRVDTTGTVWMGLTLRCARCHDHKYDPLSQTDFYRFFSFFNNLPERGLSGSGGNSVPLLQVPPADQRTKLASLRQRLLAAERQSKSTGKQLAAAQAAWEATALKNLPPAPGEGLVDRHALDEKTSRVIASGPVSRTTGVLGGAAEFDRGGCLQIENGVDFDRHDAFSISAWIKPGSPGCIVCKMDDADQLRGFDVTVRKSKAVVSLVHQWNRNAVQVTTSRSLAMGQWQHLMVTYDGSSKAKGLRIYIDGQAQPVIVGQDNLTATMRNQQPVRLGRRQASASLKGSIDEIRFYNRALSAEEVDRLASRQLLQGILNKPRANRSAWQVAGLRRYFLAHHAATDLAAAARSLTSLQAEYQRMVKSLPTTMVMQELKAPRPAYVLVRGQYDQRGKRVEPGVPFFLTRLSAPSAGPALLLNPAKQRLPNRLDLAKWLVRPSHPLTARVTVNRLWQQLFGTGIVKTLDNFGTQGDWPSHPQLLDWLAVEFVESGWDLKHLIRLIVTSATYRQSSNAQAPLLKRDRENRLLGRGPRFRLDAEMLRDNALAIGGLLVERQGGPSVHPYQPAGLWSEVTYDSDKAYGQDRGESLYRRSLYTFWKRQSPPPTMLAFDAPTRETCTVRRSRTNTPLQALALMNHPVFLEAARQLAQQSMTARRTNSERATYAFRAATARRPSLAEKQVLLDFYRRQARTFQENRGDAVKLLQVGESESDESLDTVELAAWTTVASLILCLDETITRK